MCLDGQFVSVNIHVNSMIQCFPAEFCTVASMIFISNVLGINAVAFAMFLHLLCSQSVPGKLHVRDLHFILPR